MLSEIIQVYDRKDMNCVQLKGASGEDLNASAIGVFHGLESPVVVANIEDDIIVSTSQLASSNYWTIHPPAGVFRMLELSFLSTMKSVVMENL